MLQNLVAFWRLSRPLFLLGGAVLYALGAGIARAQGYEVLPGPYALGQLFVTGVQLMTHYLNEYWDVETDRLNESRTMFSGGSGILVAGLLQRRTAIVAAVICLAIGAAAAGLLVVKQNAGPLTETFMLLIFLGAYFYSSPPLRLAGSGVGELSASLVVAGLVPAFALVNSGGRVSLEFMSIVAPLVLLHYAMVLAFEFPDESCDRQAGKRTLLVRIGRHRAAIVHNSCLLSGALMAPLTTMLFASHWAALLIGVIVVPLAAWQMFAVAMFVRGRLVNWGQMTFVALAIFAVSASLQAAALWSSSI